MNPLLFKGWRGDPVIKLQRELVKLNLLHSSEVDGVFGGITKAAVKQFQTSVGLSADGIVGNQTWAKLLKTESLGIPSQPSSIPTVWTPNNIELKASIIIGGSFTWAEATKGGSRRPPDQETLNGIVRIATLAQRARKLINRPFIVTSWYRNPQVNASVGGVSNSRHINGDAIDFYCDGMTGLQIYNLLDPWWLGGLGQYQKFPDLCHIDARGYRARWTN